MEQAREIDTPTNRPPAANKRRRTRYQQKKHNKPIATYEIQKRLNPNNNGSNNIQFEIDIYKEVTVGLLHF